MVGNEACNAHADVGQADVVVIGSGAAGLTAALTAAARGLEVVVIEKEPVFGGTTALSEGMIWVPLSAQVKAVGKADTVEAAVNYMLAAAGRFAVPKKANAYVGHAAAMLGFVEANTRARFTLSATSPDYHQDLPGATIGMRAFNPGLFDGRLLGADFARLRHPLASTMILGGMTIASADLPHFMAMKRSVKSLAHVARLAGRYGLDRASGHARGTRIANGNGLVAALALALREAGVPILTGTRAIGLERANGRVNRVRIAANGGERTIVVAKGVVLACGGFPGDPEFKSRFYPKVRSGADFVSMAPATNTGDGLRLALEVGAVLDEAVDQPAAWTPVSLVPFSGGQLIPFPHYMDRGKPGVIAVDGRAHRFTNEAEPYHRFVPAMIRASADAKDVAVHVIADHRALRRYGLGAVPPAPGRIGTYLKSGYLKMGETPALLANSIGIDAAALTNTIATFNGPAACGEDPEFGKGNNAFNRAYGDAAHAPNPCVAPLIKPPFYAVRVAPGDIATFIGLKTDASARVLDALGLPVPGLFAAGNDMTSPFGGDYPAAGITIGAAMTFGYIAGRAIGVD